MYGVYVCECGYDAPDERTFKTHCLANDHVARMPEGKKDDVIGVIDFEPMIGEFRLLSEEQHKELLKKRNSMRGVWEKLRLSYYKQDIDLITYFEKHVDLIEFILKEHESLIETYNRIVDKASYYMIKCEKRGKEIERLRSCCEASNKWDDKQIESLINENESIRAELKEIQKHSATTVYLGRIENIKTRMDKLEKENEELRLENHKLEESKKMLVEEADMCAKDRIAMADELNRLRKIEKDVDIILGIEPIVKESEEKK
jgi:chromosome segregation ATPase